MITKQVNIGAELEALRKKQRDELQKLIDFTAVADIANAIMNERDSEELTMDTGVGIGNQTIDSVWLDLKLKENQHIDVVKPLLKAIALTRQFEPAGEKDYLELNWVGWTFIHKESRLTLLVRVWFGGSTVCRLVPTGETKPVMRVECSRIQNQGE